MAGRILIADNVSTNRIILKVKLAAARYEVTQTGSADEAFALARAERPDMVILDASLPGGGGAALCARLRAEPETRGIPLMVLDSSADRARRMAVFDAGADEYVAKPVDEMTLLALVRNLMRTRATYDELTRRQETDEAFGLPDPRGAKPERPARIALVAPSPEIGVGWRRALGMQLDAKLMVMSRPEALDALSGATPPDAFVVAAETEYPGDGIRMMSELRSRAAGRHAVVVVVDIPPGSGLAPIALDVGASAVLEAPLDTEELAARLKVLLAHKIETDALRESFDRRLRLATIDPLTGLYNRRYADTYLRRMSQEAARSGMPFAIMLLDLDRFKLVNDQFGHLVGDNVLIETAERLRRNLREIDLVARFGGEEFIVAMPETDLAEAEIAAERLRRAISAEPVIIDTGAMAVPVTVSIGVAVSPAAPRIQPGLTALMQQADIALYASKSEGRNLVTFADNRAA